jgi:galactosylceramidase
MQRLCKIVATAVDNSRSDVVNRHTIGLHYPSDYNSYANCHALKKPVWASEESSSYDGWSTPLMHAWGLVLTYVW